MLIYFLYQKYQVRIRISNVPYSTIFNIDLDKVKKNLEIQSMVHNFVIAIMMIEIVANAFFGIKLILLIGTSVPCIYRNQTTFNRTNETNQLIQFMGNLSENILSLILPVLCLFLIVLRRAFINLPYKLWVRRYSVYIFVRVIAMLVLYSFSITSNIETIVQLLLALFDTRVYISSSRAFYVLLKGRRDEALYHSSQKDYLEKKKTANRFFYTQVFIHFMIFISLLFYISAFADAAINILFNPNFFEFVPFGYFPKFFFPWHTFAYKIRSISAILTGVSALLLELYAFFAYFFVLISILVKLFIRRRKFNHINDWITRPLMERYRSNLEGRRIQQQRPPFIQAIRSGLIY